MYRQIGDMFAPFKVVREALAWVAAIQADLLKGWMKWQR